jgi:hypothetical protein
MTDEERCLKAIEAVCSLAAINFPRTQDVRISTAGSSPHANADIHYALLERMLAAYRAALEPKP